MAIRRRFSRKDSRKNLQAQVHTTVAICLQFFCMHVCCVYMSVRYSAFDDDVSDLASQVESLSTEESPVKRRMKDFHPF